MNIKSLILAPVVSTIIMIVWLALFSFGIGTINSLYLLTKASGEIGSERFDRIVEIQTGDESPDDRWGLVTVVESNASVTDLADTSAYRIITPAATSSTVCDVTTGTLTAATKGYTPQGTEVTITTDGEISGCEWAIASPVLTRGSLSGLIGLLLQVAGLAGPVMLLVSIGGLGGSVASISGGSGWAAVLVAIGTVIGLVVLVALFGEVVPFLTDAYLAISENRFAMFDSGIGAVSVLIGNFLGVTAVGAVGGAIWSAWSNWKKTSSSAMGGSGQAM